MLNYLYEWIQNIAFYVVLVTAVFHVIPNTDYQRYIRFFTGMGLILMLASPILQLFGMERSLSDLYDNPEYQEQLERMEESTLYLEKIVPEQYLEPIIDEEGRGEEKLSEMKVEEIEIGR